MGQVEKLPVFKSCTTQDSLSLEDCFYAETKKAFFKEFKTPSVLTTDRFTGAVTATFVVTTEGKFRLIYLNSPYIELKEEVERSFLRMESVAPAMYNNNKVEMRFQLPLQFPTENGGKISESKKAVESKIKQPKSDLRKVIAQARDASEYNEHRSQLNIPFNHIKYIDYDYQLNKASETHTAFKPYTYSFVNAYVDLDQEKQKFLKPNKKTWLGKKLWNEHLLSIEGDGYWLNMDVLADIQLGKANRGSTFTYNNTRVLTVNGGLGDKFSFSTTYYESQGRFAGYINDYISNRSDTFKPAFSEGLVPGRGKAKGFGSDAYDYPVAEGYLAYTPNKFLQFQFGNGKNFIGDGYRSLLLSDATAPMTYFKMNFSIWKFNYTNLWLWGTDVRAPVVVNNEHARKYVAIHYLSINITDRLNLGLFETAVSKGDQGFDVGYLNPVIFYRSIEFNRGEDSGNAMIGLTAKYKLKENIHLYSQLIVDEFSFGKISDLGYWGNKFGVQLGAKYFNAFDVDDLYLQAEFNTVRPYTYAHKDPVLNYANYSQPLGHSWGANFWEALVIANYKFDRWTTSAKFILGQKGFDPDDTISYGGDVYKSYDTRRGDNNNELGQGNKATIFIADLQARYLLNPSNNLSLFTGLTIRKFSAETTTPNFESSNDVWFTLGIKADLFNWYFDF
ncbi:hypothetical protein GCM10011416_09670 [Polaribacter pacificus]|uniref:Protein involved in gliding motility RemB n=2 Tax=Polaribacter pacificus TaxID=1775173 RepID=A0A917HXS1_9FLAO|nr:hypothetical protein GCM10011416_09670 [Polaribacter pacificus]